MEVGVRDLRNNTARVVDAVKSGQLVILTDRGEPIADIVPHARRQRWLSGRELQQELAHRAADAALKGELDELAGNTLDHL